jgi:hypothetical protein
LTRYSSLKEAPLFQVVKMLNHSRLVNMRSFLTASQFVSADSTTLICAPCQEIFGKISLPAQARPHVRAWRICLYKINILKRRSRMSMQPKQGPAPACGGQALMLFFACL